MKRHYISPTGGLVFGKQVEPGSKHQMTPEDAAFLIHLGVLTEDVEANAAADEARAKAEAAKAEADEKAKAEAEKAKAGK